MKMEKSNQDVPMSQVEARRSTDVPDTEIKDGSSNFQLLYAYVLGNKKQREFVADELMEKLKPEDIELLFNELVRLRSCLVILKRAMV